MYFLLFKIRIYISFTSQAKNTYQLNIFIILMLGIDFTKQKQNQPWQARKQRKYRKSISGEVPPP